MNPKLVRAWYAVIAASALVIVASVLSLAARGSLVPAASAGVRLAAVRETAQIAHIPVVAPHPAQLPARIILPAATASPAAAAAPARTVTVTVTRTATATATATQTVQPAPSPSSPAPSPSTPAPSPSTPAPAPSPSASTGSYIGLRILAKAESRANDLYAWGGTGPDTFDCSGLVYWAATAAGETSWPRDTADIAAAIGTRFTVTSSPQPGDLALWGSGTPYHVEIVTGPGRTFGIQTYGWAGRATWHTGAADYYLHINY